MLDPHFSQRLRSLTPKSLQDQGSHCAIALDCLGQCVDLLEIDPHGLDVGEKEKLTAFFSRVVK